MRRASSWLTRCMPSSPGQPRAKRDRPQSSQETASVLLGGVPRSGNILHAALAGLLASASGKPPSGNAPRESSFSFRARSLTGFLGFREFSEAGKAEAAACSTPFARVRRGFNAPRRCFPRMGRSDVFRESSVATEASATTSSSFFGVGKGKAAGRSSPIQCPGRTIFTSFARVCASLFSKFRCCIEEQAFSGGLRQAQAARILMLPLQHEEKRVCCSALVSCQTGRFAPSEKGFVNALLQLRRPAREHPRSCKSPHS